MMIIKGLTKAYQDKVIFKQVDFKAEAGQFILLMGKSGIGKSTFLDILAGLKPAQITSYRYQDRSLNPADDEAMSAFRNQFIGYIPQDFTLIPDYTVKENLLLPALYHPQLTAEAVESTIQHLVKEFEMKELLGKKVKDLSGGQKQRVAFMRSLVLDPAILLADEPTTNLDKENFQLIVQLLKEQQQKGKIIIVATHDERMRELASHIYQIKDQQVYLEEME